MPKCVVTIYAMTGLQELNKLQSHFAKKHKIVLSMNAALQFRETMEAGECPVRIEEKHRQKT